MGTYLVTVLWHGTTGLFMEIEHIFWSLIWLRFFHTGAKLILLFNMNIHDIFFLGCFIISKLNSRRNYWSCLFLWQNKGQYIFWVKRARYNIRTYFSGKRSLKKKIVFKNAEIVKLAGSETWEKMASGSFKNQDCNLKMKIGLVVQFLF